MSLVVNEGKRFNHQTWEQLRKQVDIDITWKILSQKINAFYRQNPLHPNIQWHFQCWMNDHRIELAKITTLDLSNRHILYLPQEVFQLVNLKTLDLAHNPLNSLPNGIGKLKYLTTLCLKGTWIEKVSIGSKTYTQAFSNFCPKHKRERVAEMKKNE